MGLERGDGAHMRLQVTVRKQNLVTGREVGANGFGQCGKRARGRRLDLRPQRLVGQSPSRRVAPNPCYLPARECLNMHRAV